MRTHASSRNEPPTSITSHLGDDTRPRSKAMTEWVETRLERTPKAVIRELAANPTTLELAAENVKKLQL